MLSPTIVGTIIYACMLIILCIGFTLTHIMEKFPNFAHASYATIGTMLTFNFVRIWGYNPYLVIPFAFLLGGGIGVALYVSVVRPMQRRGRGGITLTFATLALSIVLTAFLAIYSYWVMYTYGFRAGSFILKSYDFTWLGYPGVFFVAPLISIVLVVSLHVFLTRARFGVAIRAAYENPVLSSALGVNITKVHLVSWFLTGAMSALAGAILPLWMSTRLGSSDELLVSVIAGSVLGGLDNIYGAIIGGIVIAMAQRILPGLLIRVFGIWIAGYEPFAPILVIVTVLLLEPQGITGFVNGEHSTLQRIWGRLTRPSASDK